MEEIEKKNRENIELRRSLKESNKQVEMFYKELVGFIDSVQRLQVYESTTALLRGMYSGFMDTSKIDKEQFNFMREIKLTH